MTAMLGELPTWKLEDLYSSPTGPDLDADLKRAAADAEAFAKDYEGKVASLDGKALGGAVARFEKLSDLMGRIGSYASLYYAQNMADPERGRFSQNVSEALTDIGTKLVFFRLELNKLEDADLVAKQKDPALAKYGPWLRDLRVYRPHQLSDELEKALHEKHVVGRAAWSRLFDETIARLRYPFRNEVLTEPQILDKLSNKDAEVRKDAAKSFGKVQGDNIAIFSLVTNTLAKDKEIEDRWRKYPRPQSAMNLGNVVEDEVVDALAASVKAAYPRLAHRYYKLKAKWFGVDNDAVLGPQRAAARARRSRDPVGRGREDRARRLSCLLARAGRCRPKVLRHRLDRRAGAAGQVAGRLRPSDGAVGASLSAAELPGQGARRDDAGARAGPRRAPGAGGAAGRADGRHAADAGRDRLGVRRDADLPVAA